MASLKQIWKANDISFGSKVVLSIVAPLTDKWVDFVKTPTGSKVAEKLAKDYDYDHDYKEEHPGKWAAKKIAKGTAKGLPGVPFSDN